MGIRELEPATSLIFLLFVEEKGEIERKRQVGAGRAEGADSGLLSEVLS